MVSRLPRVGGAFEAVLVRLGGFSFSGFRRPQADLLDENCRVCGGRARSQEKAVADALLQGAGVGGLTEQAMSDTYFVSFGDAVRPIRVAGEKYSGISRHAKSSAALPRWHSSTAIRPKKPGGNYRDVCRCAFGPAITR